MTGIERLREQVDRCKGWAQQVSNDLADIADQIERELREERDRWDSELCEAQMDKTRVMGVYLEMERHVSGVEGAEDSPVAHWARELRGALKSYTSDGSDGEKPSCADPDGAADVTSDAAKVTRDPAEDVSMSAYDLLPSDERDAIAWVREHGGLESVKKLLDWVVGHCSTKQQLDFDFWLSGRVMYELGFEEDMADRDEVERRLLARLVPEGMAWLVEAWPRFEDGEPVGFGDEASRLGEVWRICLYRDGSFSLNFRAYSKGERVRRPSVLAADGVEVHKGDEVWSTTGEFDGKRTVSSVYIDPDELPYATFEERQKPYSCLCCYLTHRAPVLAADGLPLREREHVYHVETGAELVVKGLPKPGEYQAVVVFALPTSPASHLTSFDPDQLTHTKPEPPDSWERIEDDAGCTATKYNERRGTIFTTKQQVARDLVRRCRALAERERGE